MKILRWFALFIAGLLVAAWFFLPGMIENRNNHVRHHPPYTVSAAATELHNKLVVADLHADSLLWKRNLLEHGTRG
ncbi:MAG TPA: hypothetical protein VKT33_12300 [Candidatus Angelobacter sp.]|nr:hypothetical protein [Candidatus Angelobacter sp.]